MTSRSLEDEDRIAEMSTMPPALPWGAQEVDPQPAEEEHEYEDLQELLQDAKAVEAVGLQLGERIEVGRVERLAHHT